MQNDPLGKIWLDPLSCDHFRLSCPWAPSCGDQELECLPRGLVGYGTFCVLLCLCSILLHLEFNMCSCVSTGHNSCSMCYVFYIVYHLGFITPFGSPLGKDPFRARQILAMSKKQKRNKKHGESFMEKRAAEYGFLGCMFFWMFFFF